MTRHGALIHQPDLSSSEKACADECLDTSRISSRKPETRRVAHLEPMHVHDDRKHRAVEHLAWRGINLPSRPGSSDERVRSVTSALQESYEHAS